MTRHPPIALRAAGRSCRDHGEHRCRREPEFVAAVVDRCRAGLTRTIATRTLFQRRTDAAQDHHEEAAAMAAKGFAEWKGDLQSGSGTFTAGDTISGDYSFKSRFEDGPGANPEQLIAAAHASCFSMALSNMLAEAGTPPESVRTDATVTLRPVDGVPTITKIALVTVGRVPGIDAAAFAEHAAAAKAGCPVSRALAGVPEITLSAALVQ
jgi:lipoyl-dependent peroxiredoxin